MGDVKIIPVGGLGEVGKNMMAIDTGDDLVAVDCGLMFPREDMLGVDLVLPDARYFVENKSRLRAILITHGHEDHIGALAYILPSLPDVPVYATRLTAGLIEAKLREDLPNTNVDLRLYAPGDAVRLGGITVKPFRVNHSIPDSVGLCLETPAGRVIHTGDFKFDRTPVDGQQADYDMLRAWGDDGVLVLCSDSTYAEREGHSGSEMEVGEALKRVIAGSKGRVIVATFASLIARVQQVIDAAVATGRKVSVSGRSMERNVEIATQLGYLRIPAGVLILSSDIGRYQPKDLVLITTGSQGEPMSSLSRVAAREHRHIRIQEGDTVIISANPIPGNETSINRVIDNLFQQGAEVLYSRVSDVHVQGHGSRDELREMLELTRPRYFVPVHGEYRMLIAHAKLARETGVAGENIFVLQDGEVLRVGPDGAGLAGNVPAEDIFVDGLAVGDVTPVVLRDRRQMANDGVLVVVYTVNGDNGSLAGEPDILTRGFVYSGEWGKLEEKVRNSIASALNKRAGSASLDYKIVNGKIRDELSRFVWEQTRGRPMILPFAADV